MAAHTTAPAKAPSPLIERLRAGGIVAPRTGGPRGPARRPAPRARLRVAREGVGRRAQRVRARPDHLQRPREGHAEQLRPVQAPAPREPQPLDAGRRTVPAHVVGVPGLRRRRRRLLAARDQHAHGVQPPRGAGQALRGVRRRTPLQRQRRGRRGVQPRPDGQGPQVGRDHRPAGQRTGAAGRPPHGAEAQGARARNAKAASAEQRRLADAADGAAPQRSGAGGPPAATTRPTAPGAGWSRTATAAGARCSPRRRPSRPARATPTPRTPRRCWRRLPGSRDASASSSTSPSTSRRSWSGRPRPSRPPKPSPRMVEPPPHAVAVTEGRAATAAPATKRPPEKCSVPELLREVEALETRKRQLRDELIERYRARRRAARPAPRRAAPRGARRRRPRRRRRSGTSNPLGGRVGVVTTLGDSGVFVRRSKIALSRYLAKNGTPEHAALRKRLRREAATPRTGNVASPAWGRAVSEAPSASRGARRPASSTAS